jgi:hypothetical protein
MKPRWFRIVELRKQSRDADLSALTWTHGPGAQSDAALDAAKSTDRLAFEQPQNLRPAH